MTLTSAARAIHRFPQLRALCIAALVALPSLAGAQRRARPSPQSARIAAPARWDSLFLARRYFQLRESVNAWNGANDRTTEFYRGIIAHAFNDNDAAIAALAPLIDSMPAAFAATHAAPALAALGDSYLRVFRYDQSAAAYERALRLPRSSMDAVARNGLRDWAAVARSLVSIPPQQIRWTAQWKTTPVDNDSTVFAVSTMLNGSTLPVAFDVDAAARLSIIDSTAAATRNVRVLRDTVHVTVHGRRFAAQVGTIGELRIGPALLLNVAVLVVPDASLSALYPRSPVRGVLGLPVLSALGGFTFTRNGHIALSSPGADNDTSAAPNVAIANDALLARVTYADRRVPLVLDAGADRTVLYPLFLEAFPSATKGATLTTHVGRGTDGSLITLPAYVIPDASFTINGRPVEFDELILLMRGDDPRSRLYLGTLGRDALQAADRVTLDFNAMTLRFRDRPPPSVLPRIVYPTAIADSTSVVSKVPEDIAFVILLFALFVIPKALQRYRLASAVTSLVMGAAATALGLFHNDPTLHLLSTFGIVALFLFAGLEIDGHQLRRQASPLMLHGLVWAVLLAMGAAVATLVFGFAVRPALLIALALLTPSTGFILSSLPGFGLHDSDRFAVKTYAIASELLALTVLFFVLQSTSATRLAIATAAMLGVVIVIPLAFRLFARVVAPHAPRSEFAFLLMVAIVCAYATRRLGVYYLVGAFIVGIAAQRFRSELPAMSSEKMVDALESFGSVFIPFYFFHAGTQIVREQITLRAIAIGVCLIALLVPLRVAITVVQRRFVLRDTMPAARRVGIALIPTLVFTLVIVEILGADFGVANYVLGALVLYTVINTSIPAFVLHSAPPEFENVEAAYVESPES